MNPHKLKSMFFNQDFKHQDRGVKEYATEEEREEDERRMMYCPIRDDARRIFLAGCLMMRNRIRNVRSKKVKE